MGEIIRFLLYAFCGILFFVSTYSILVDPNFIADMDIGNFSLEKQSPEKTISCEYSLNEWIRLKKLRKGEAYDINLYEKRVINSEEEMRKYVTDYGGEGGVGTSSVLRDIDKFTYPEEVALIYVKYKSMTWFYFGKCNNNEFERLHDLGFI